MKTKEIDGVLYKLVPEKENSSCEGCAFSDTDRSICTTLTNDCGKGFIYKEANQPMSNFHLKPFDLEAAKAGKPVCTRDGRKARIICFDCKDQHYPIVALIEYDDTEVVQNYSNKGKAIIGDEWDKDLMMLPEKKEGWVNIYHGIDASSYRSCGFIYDTKEQAVKEASSDYITTVKINWEE